jgi:hypothetical protein
VVSRFTPHPLASALIVAVGCAALACGSQMARGQGHASAKSAQLASAAVATSTDSAAAAITAPGVELAAIEDPSGQALAVFHAALRRAESGAGQARIVFYGASHVADDLFTGPVRQRLQQRFGDAGPGFVLLGRPWRWYRHAGIEIEQSRGLKPFRVIARAPEDGIYGLAGIALDAKGSKPAVAAFSTRAGHGQSGRVSRLELYYLKQRRGGRLTLHVDGRVKQRVETAADRPETGYAALELEDVPHRIELRTAGDGPVRVFGMALERDVPGVILDTLGVPGARARDHLH